MPKNVGECALCKRKNQILKKSHIIPKLVYEREKTYKNSIFRNYLNPKEIYQAGEKKYLLCSDCEQYFSKYEREFANKFLDKFLENEEHIDNLDSIMYEGVNRYIISVCWRILYDDLYVRNSDEYTLNRDVFENFERRLRKYLNQIREDIKITDEQSNYCDFDKLTFGEKIAFCENQKENLSTEILENIDCHIFILSKLIKNKKQLRDIEDKIFGRSFDCRNSIDYIVYMVANGLVICVRLHHKRGININSNPFATIISSKSRNIKRELREEIIFAYNQKKEAEPLVNNFLNTNDTREKILNRYRNKKREK